MIQKVRTICSVCQKPLVFEVESDEFKNKPRYPVSLLLTHEDHQIITYLDANLKVRGVEGVDKCLVKEEVKNRFEFEINPKSKKGIIKSKGNSKVFFLD